MLPLGLVAPLRAPLALTVAGLLVACGDGATFDATLEVENCGGTACFERPPRRVVALNQTAAEVLLALGLEDRIVATGFPDNPPPAELAAAYEAIPVHWPGYPAPEQFVEVEPDFAYATFTSAFGHDVPRARQTLRSFAVEVYVSPWLCAGGPAAGDPVSFDPVARELREVAAVFGVEARGAALVSQLEQRLEAVRTACEARPGPPPVVVWWVSGEEQPMLAAGQGCLQLATEAARALHLHADSPGFFTVQSWEQFAAREANWIGLLDQASSPAARKREFLMRHPATADLRAVREERFVVVPFADTLPGVGVPRVAEALAAALATDFDGSRLRPAEGTSR